MTGAEFEAMAEQFRTMPASPYSGFGYKEGTNKMRVLKDGEWIEGHVEDIGSAYTILIDDGYLVSIPKTYIHPS